MPYPNSPAWPGKRMAALAPLVVWSLLSLPLPPSAAQSAIPLRANGKIAFTSDRDGNREIYVMNADGTNQVRLTNNPSPDDYPTFSPDGTKIAFVSQGASGGFFYLSVMNADGTNKVEIKPIRNFMTNPAQFSDFWAMSWSQDGNRIAFQETARIFVVNLDGSNRHRLIDASGSEFEPSWSPDGSKILFASSRDRIYPTLYTVKPDGTDLQAFPGFDGNWEIAPNWSPSGDKVLFVTDYTGDDFIPVSVIFTANADGTNRQRFDGDGDLSYRNKPSWSPDGSKIIFDKWESSSGDMEIYVKNTDGSGFAQLTNSNGWNLHPSWQPLSVRVIPRRPMIRRGGLLSSAIHALEPAALAQPPVSNPGWSYTGSLNTTRSGHTATLLPDGKVLVVGGSSTTGFASAELYDPSTGTWSLTGSLNGPRVDYTATLLGNGKVLVAGGYAYRGQQLEPTNTAELYDPATREWSFTDNPKVPRAGHTATLLHNGNVLFAGGGILTKGEIGIDFSPTNTAELYDPATGKWSSTGNLSGDRYSHAATRLQDGKVLVAGGCMEGDCNIILGSAEVYDPNTETWSATGIHTPRDSHTLTLLPNGNVLMSGGQRQGIPFTLNTAEIYNPATGLWSDTGSLLKRRWGNTVTLLPSGQVLVAGGYFSYDSAMPGHTEDFNSAELYDPITGKWNTTASLNTARSGHAATLLTNGRALIVGGVDDQGTALRSAELYSTTGAGTVITVSAASYRPLGLASEGITTSFGAGLTTTTLAATTLPLPTQLANTTVKIKDSAGAERLAPLFFVSPTQVNYQIPPGTAAGAAAITITSGDGTVSTGVALIHAIAPSLFAANANGQGVAAAFALRVKADGSQQFEPLTQFDAAQNKFVARPLDLGPAGEQVYLVLFGTGVRQRRTLSAVIASIGGAYAAVSYAGAQPDFAGLDQVNVLVPRNLSGRGEVDVLLTVEAQIANPVRVNIK